jgi:hypothetical protein
MILQLRVDRPSIYCYWAPPRGVGRNWYACAPNATLILVCVYELMHAKKQANINVPPTRPGGRRVAGASPFKTLRCGKLKSVREGISKG